MPSTQGSPGQNLDGMEEIGEVSRTVGLGHDVVFQVSWDLGLPEEDHTLRPIKQKVIIGVVLQMGSPGHIRKLKQRLAALTVQFVEGTVKVILVLKLADMLVSLSQDVKYPLPRIPPQQVSVTQVRDEKLGISSRCSPHAVSLKRDISGAQPLLQCATIVASGFLRMISVPFWRRALVEILLRITMPL